MSKKKETTNAIPEPEYRMNQDTYDSIKNLLDTILRGTGMEGLKSVNGVLDGIIRVELDER